MSSIRIFILGALQDQGPAHGYQLRVLAEEGRVHNWTDITPGAIYGALKRLLKEGLVQEVRSEQEGSRPQRQIVQITDAGRTELERLRLEALTAFRLSPDPFDLALARPGTDLTGRLEQILRERREQIHAQAVEYQDRIPRLAQVLTPLEELVMHHRLLRLRAEVAFLDQALDDLPALVEKEQHPHP